MTAITAGGGATIGATTLEGQFLQLIEYFQSLEAAAGNTTNFFAGSYDSDTLIFTGNFNVPIKFNDPLNLVFTGDPDTGSFPTGTFTPGTGGTFTAPLAINYFIQVVSRLMTLQNDLSKNPQKTQNITASINLNRNTLSGSFTVPYTKSTTATGISINAATYLL
ncbi:MULTISPECIES: hypothetical protein [unclassified Microcoleus]|uniref:hypothetical protein n=1 Tax=unclassified Microcoleus TaxID=2642155 RepID=UPI002FD69453